MVILRPDLCVRVTGGSYAEESYTCVRTNGQKEGGWCMPTAESPHTCFMLREMWSRTWNPSGFAHYDREHLGQEAPFWRVFLHGPDGTGHSCGWRPVGTFWPSRLDGDEGARQEWITALIAQLDAAEAERDKSGDPDYVTCRRI